MQNRSDQLKPAPSNKSLLLHSRTYEKIRTSLGENNSPGGMGRQGGPVVVLVKNTTAARLEQWAAIELGATLADGTTDEGANGFSYQNVFLGIDTTAETAKLAILQAGSDVNEFTAAIVSGLTTAIVNVTDADHGFCRPVASGKLESTDDVSSIQLIFAPVTGDDTLCKVLLSGGGGTSTMAFAVDMTQVGG
ncbi:unnamed protein product, partial [marine sediment metagenome]